jgi:2',3'-cyclic-nucleotide 2'-phosphodiesterase (5'-nucleotidase family)
MARLYLAACQMMALMSNFCDVNDDLDTVMTMMCVHMVASLTVMYMTPVHGNCDDYDILDDTDAMISAITTGEVYDFLDNWDACDGQLLRL